MIIVWSTTILAVLTLTIEVYTLIIEPATDSYYVAGYYNTNVEKHSKFYARM